MKNFNVLKLAVGLLLSFSTFTAFSQYTVYPDPFLTDETRPDGVYFLPPPPSMSSGEFFNDYYYYQWGKQQRDTQSGIQAALDEDYELCDAFSDAFGIKLSQAETPEILLLAESAVSDAQRANKRVKNFYQRRRPFAQFNEPSLLPEADERESVTYSYPSGHTTRGWTFALALSTVAPEATNALMLRAREYALSRVICGRHWKSDIDNALMLAAAVFSNVVVTQAYQQQLVKAREEYNHLKGL